MERLALCLSFLLCCCCSAELEMVERQVEHADTSPRLHLVRDFASDAEMDYIIKEAFPHQRPQDQNTETGMVTELPVAGSTLASAVFDRMRSVIPALAEPFTRDTGPLHTLRVRRYLPDGIGSKGGDHHPPHTDWYQPSEGDHTLIVTMILYLTSPEEGGTTHFEHANQGKGYHFQPTRGNLAIWWSCYNNGTQDFHSKHSSEPLLKGIKWNAARFFYTDTKNCAAKVMSKILVPEAANHNKPMASSFDVLFNTTFPPGVSVSDEGTRTNAMLHGEAMHDADGPGHAGLHEEMMERDEEIQAEIRKEVLERHGKETETAAAYAAAMAAVERLQLVSEAHREMEEFARSQAEL